MIPNGFNDYHDIQAAGLGGAAANLVGLGGGYYSGGGYYLGFQVRSRVQGLPCF